MEIDSAGWLHGVRRVPSPNRDSRPPGTEVDLVVLHGISLPPGEFGGPHVEALFTNRLACADHPSFSALEGLCVSAHVVIGRDGAVTQYVSFLERAWHAGSSEFEGRSRCNDFSIGIELEGTDDRPYTDAQYAALAQLLGVLMEIFPCITADRVVGHCHVAPERKTDPGPAFDWARVRRALPTGTDRGASEA